MPTGEIKFEDNSTIIGKGRIEKFCYGGAGEALCIWYEGGGDDTGQLQLSAGAMRKRVRLRF